MQKDPSTTNKTKEFIKKHKKPLIIGGVAYLVLMVAVLAWAVSAVMGGDSNSNQVTDSSYTTPEDKYPRVDVNGLSVQEACSKLQEKGWKVGSVYGTTEDYKDSEISDCTKANGTVTDVNYYGDSLSLYYTYTKESSDNDTGSTATETPKSRHKVSQDAAEQFCQDANLLNKYVDSSKISTIYITNYNVRYTDSGSYDKNGNPIWFFQWNGKNKSTDEAARFSCWISGSGDSSSDITLHWLSLSGLDLYGSAGGFDSYREDGTKIE